MRMSISLITLWYNFTYCVSQGTGLVKTNSAILLIPQCRRLRQSVVTLTPRAAAACTRVALLVSTRKMCSRSKSLSLIP